MTRPLLLCRRGLLAVLTLFFLFGFSSTLNAQDADLGIVKSASSATAGPDTDVQYDISVSNFSGTTSTPTNTLTDNVPVGMTFVSETHPVGWSCTSPAVGSGGTITCTSPDPIADGSSVLFTFVFHVNAGVTNGTVITNTATISHAGVDPNSENDSSSATVTVGAAAGGPLAAHDVLISEFRLSGPGGNSDEYIEFYCNRDTDCDIGGASIRSFDPSVGDFSVSFPFQTIIPARQYLLIADNTQFSLPGYATPDFNVHDPMIADFFLDNEGIQLIGNAEPIVIDSVGFIGGGNDGAYIEGTGLQRATGPRPADQYAYVRRRETGPLVDTDNNAADFVLVSVTGTAHPGISALPVLGAPGPQSLSSPKSYKNAQMTGSLVEPAVDAHITPNRVRVGVGDTGTLSIRRTITNNTSQTFDYVRFRVIDIPTLHSPNPGGRAELRLITSGDAETFVNSQTRQVIIRGTTLEYDSGTEPVQPNGGGLNSSVRANLAAPAAPAHPADVSFTLPAGSLVQPGNTLDVQFLLNVVKAGDYRFYVFVEARTANQLVAAPPAPPAPRQLINLKRAAKAVAPASKKPKPNTLFPTKSTNGPVVNSSTRPVINLPMAGTPVNKKRDKRKKVRRRSSAALHAQAEAKRPGQSPAPN
ncbi:MAG TPA: hypothetical protein VIU65_05630 [Pyrinomonadaceae bacterium]